MMLKRTNTNETTDIICIIDESGSMHSLRDITINNFNEFLQDQEKAEGLAKVSLFTFNTRMREVYVNKSLKQAKLNRKNYNPASGTALNDAIGEVLTQFNSSADKVVVVIITDGQENSSREFSRSQVRRLIEDKTREFDWAFQYLGANQDAFEEAKSYGIPDNFVTNYNATDRGTRRAFMSASNLTTNLRGQVGTSHYSSTCMVDATDETDSKKDSKKEQPWVNTGG